MKLIVNLNSKYSTAFPHYWEECIGSCHALMGVRIDWRTQLKKCHDELGFKYLRFHGLLNDEMSLLAKNKSGDYDYSFYNLDLVFDFLLEIGMKPFIELSFMPEAFASGNKTVFHYKANITPPKNYNDWAELIEKLTRHLVLRYGIEEVRSWFFEVWTEPNSKRFWTGSRDEYFKLYQTTALAVKKVDSELSIGGPATTRSAWIPEFIKFCKTENVPCDFISTHHYSTDTVLGQYQEISEQMTKTTRGILQEMTFKAKQEAHKYPLFYTKWGSSSGTRNPYHDEPDAAAFLVKTFIDNLGLAKIYSYLAFSDIFEENTLSSLPFHGGAGLMNLHGIPKPTYRAYQLLQQLGEKRIPVIQETNQETTVEAVATSTSDKLIVLLYNHQIPNAPINDETVKLILKGIEHEKEASLMQIDAEHANPKKTWLNMDSPESPTPEQNVALHKSSELNSHIISGKIEDNSLTFELKIPAHGVTALKIDWSA